MVALRPLDVRCHVPPPAIWALVWFEEQAICLSDIVTLPAALLLAAECIASAGFRQTRPLDGIHQSPAHRTTIFSL